LEAFSGEREGEDKKKRLGKRKGKGVYGLHVSGVYVHPGLFYFFLPFLSFYFGCGISVMTEICAKKPGSCFT
jgi:hypothetical protein